MNLFLCNAEYQIVTVLKCSSSSDFLEGLKRVVATKTIVKTIITIIMYPSNVAADEKRTASFIEAVDSSLVTVCVVNSFSSELSR
mgnify:CR=1 FL=1